MATTDIPGAEYAARAAWENNASSPQEVCDAHLTFDKAILPALPLN